MAWQVYGAMDGQDGNSRFQSRMPTIYGPLPVKRWVKSATDKRHKLSYKFSFKRSGSEDANEYNSRRATEYARWLAKRDGISLPENRAVKVIRPPVTRTANTRRRISAVYFGDVCIPIPHWDWEPIEPQEEIIPDMQEDMLLAA
jgi:hypothetical protein